MANSLGSKINSGFCSEGLTRVLMTCVLAAGLVFSTSACSSSALQLHNPLLTLWSTGQSTTGEIPSLVSQSYLPSGSIVISKTLPEELAIQNVQSSASKLFSPIVGYFPSNITGKMEQGTSTGARLAIDLDRGELTLFDGSRRLFSAKADGFINVKPGTVLTVSSKELKPLWYATDSYFTSRGLGVPKSSDRDGRWRRGALGEAALFLSNGQIIHSAHWWTAEVGGWRVSESSLKSIFDKIRPGTPVVVSGSAT